jgi:hypothetical protein
MTDLNVTEIGIETLIDLAALEARGSARRTPEEALHLVRNDVLDSDENAEEALFEFMHGAVGDEEGIENFEKVYTARDGKPAFRINGFGTMRNGRTLVLAVADFKNVTDVVELKTEDRKRLLNLALRYATIIEENAHHQFPKGGTDREIADRVQAAYEKCDSLRIIVMTDLHVTKSVVSSGRKEFYGRSFTAAFWGPTQYSEAVSPDGTGANINYDLTEMLDGNAVLPFIKEKTSDKNIETFAVFLPGSILADIYATYGQRAMEANIRAFLGSRKKVNADIAKSLDGDPGMFVARNNGITLLASSVDIETVDGVRGIKSINGLQIVNGGQTTASLFFASRKAKQLATVMCKIVVGTSELRPNMTKEVSKSSNSQNAINEVDLTANDAGNVEFERLSRSLSITGKQWYYERIRCQFDSEKLQRRADKTDLARFLRRYDISRKITKTDVATVTTLWDGLPHFVTAGAQSNFTRWHKRTGGLPTTVDGDFFKRIVASVIIFRAARNLVKTMFKDHRQAIVNYTLALIAKDLNSKEFFDRIWAAQAIPDELATRIRDLSEWVNIELRAVSGDRAPAAISRMEKTWVAIEKSYLEAMPERSPSLSVAA